MHFAVVGAGAVGGFYGAKLARAGSRVTFIARGAHLRAIRERGLMVWSPLGDFTVKAAAEEDPAAVGPVDVVLFAVKTYDNRAAVPLLGPLLGERTAVLTLQNGVDSAAELAAVVGEQPVLAGATYVAAARSAPGLIEQTGTHRRIVFGEAFGDRSRVSERAMRIREVLAAAGIEADAVADIRVPLWEKFIYLSPFAAFTGAARLPIGPLWADEFIKGQLLEAVSEVERVARAEGVAVRTDVVDAVRAYTDALPPSTRSSLLIDLSQGRPLELEALHGAVIRRARAYGVETPITAALYGILKPHAGGVPGRAPGEERIDLRRHLPA